MKRQRRTTRLVFFAFLAVLVWLPAASAFAMPLYIDYDGGSDASDGRSTVTAWRHCPGDANATGVPAGKTLAAGDVVYFKKGVTYQGQITCGQSGALKVSRSAGAVTAGGVFTDSGANFVASGVTTACQIYIYHSKTSVTDTWVESVGLFSIASVDSATQLTLAGFTGAAHSTAEMTYIISLPITYTSTAAWGSGDATIDGQNTRYYCFICTSRSYLRFESLKFANLAFNGAFEWSAAIYDGTYMAVVGCTFQNLAVNATNVGNYSVCKGCTSTNVAYYGICAGSTRYGLIEDCSVTGSTRTSTGGRFIVVRRNYYKDITGGFQGNHGDGIGPIDQGASNDNEYGWIYANVIDNSVEFIALYGVQGLPRYFVIHSNVFIGRYAVTGNGDAALLIKDSTYLYIYNNTFVDGLGSGGGFIHAIRLENDVTGSSHITIVNNEFYAPSAAVHFIRLDSTSLVGHTIDYNHYYTVGAYPFMVSLVDKTLTQWKAYGYEAHSAFSDTTTDPRFVSPTADPPDLHLQLNSSLVGAGFNLSNVFVLDKDGQVRPGPKWDIGAFSASGSSPPPSTPVGAPRNLRLKL